VVLNFHTPDQTWLAVRSLASSFRVPDEVIVVNNGGELPPMASVPASSGCDREAVRVIDPGRNLGFAGGVNAGILDAFARSADFVLLVNSDAVLEPDALDSLLQAANRDASAGILAPLLLTRVEPSRVASAGIDYSESTGRVRSVMTGALAADMTGEPFEVSAVSGCVMLIRRAAFEAVGGFDGEYFFSFEDVDLCLRARRAGHRVLCVPRARAHHEGSHSIGKRSSRRIYFATRNHLRLAASLEPLTLRRLMRGAFIVVLNAAYVLTSPDAPLVAGLAAVARGTRDHILGRYGVGPAA
jgi:GT2 family glycosyltransferase